LLREVAGTKVYEQKRAESTKIMEETGKLVSAEDSHKLTSRLKTRKDRRAIDVYRIKTRRIREKEELKEYQEKDRERRCLDYAVYQRELDETTRMLDGVSFLLPGAFHS
jgi:structural maintenance of chromosome 3 (chondroitin sulfate proteoglycan 6)